MEEDNWRKITLVTHPMAIEKIKKLFIAADIEYKFELQHFANPNLLNVFVSEFWFEEAMQILLENPFEGY